ncbi:MAG: hypothetical protein H7Z39_06235 [Burkholderiaceae bacterium]|nr:hypothetical protein [Burkholderiaceae bacterium]
MRTAELASTLAGQGLLPVVEVFSVSQQLIDAQLTEQAIALYRLWLEHARSPGAHAVLFNLGVALSSMQDDAGAEDAYRRAIVLHPAFVEAHLNLATLLERKGDAPGAIALLNFVTGLTNPAVAAERDFHLQALNNIGRLLEIKKLFPEAEAMLTKSLLIEPKQPKVLTHVIHLRQKQCSWPIYAPIDGVSRQEMIEATSALAMLSASDEPRDHLDAARRFVAEKVLPPTEPLAPPNGYRHDKLRIGYLSSDLQSHAVAILTAELYELHDRGRVEVYAFSWSSEDGTPLRARVVKAMDHYVPIAALSDEQAARCIRSHEIDILIDLHGLTLGTRPDILSWRPAPVQLTYLGFPGPTALPCIDYVLADPFVLPPELAPYFTERPLYMPHSFQINDRQRQVSARPSRDSCGLPADAFVFCSFNNNFKFTEEVFACWMRILLRVPNSVLWLVSDHEAVRQNLSASAQRLGVDPARLLFAARVAPADYLARYQAADLFLDTAPFNAGTTASDALWAGLPLLTCAGKTFSSRMAGSLLLAVDLPELITYNLADYEEQAVSLANAPERIAALKLQLQENRLRCSLFDSPRFVRELEDLLVSVAKTPDPNVRDNVLVILSESDLAAALAVAPELDYYKTFVFDAGLVDKATQAGLRNIEFIHWDGCPDYFALDQSSNQLVYEIERALTAAARDLMPEVNLLSWQHLHLYYMVKSARWYQGMWHDLAHRFDNTLPYIFLNDNPAQFYWPSFIPSLILLETLISRGVEFKGFSAGGRGDHPGFIPLLVRGGEAPAAAEILTHLPTCFYDAQYFNDELDAAGKDIVNLQAKYWDIPIERAVNVPLVQLSECGDHLPAELARQIEDCVEQLRRLLGELLLPYIRTADYRARQAQHLADLFRAQIWTYFLLGSYFEGARPVKMLLSDHDTDYLGPLVSYAAKHHIPVLILPHSKVSPDLFFSYDNATSLMHPMCGETILDAGGKRVRHFDLAYPESMVHQTAFPAPLRRIGLLLNAITTSGGVYNTRYTVYMDGIKRIVAWCRANQVELLIRSKPSYTMTALLREHTGIGEAALHGWMAMPMSEFAGLCELCLMYDAPTSGALEFLNASIPILNPVPEELSKVEARVCNPRVVPRASVEKTLTTLDSFVADDMNLFYFRSSQFQNHLHSYKDAHPLRAFI